MTDNTIEIDNDKNNNDEVIFCLKVINNVYRPFKLVL